MGHFVGNSLYVIWFELSVVIDNDVMSGCHCALRDMLRNKEKVEQISTCDSMVNH